MKPSRLIAIGLLAGPLTTTAQFNPGSTGVDGDLNVTSNRTLNLPADGVFNFQMITVQANATLRFNRNSNNTPVYLLATGNVNIMGTIDVSGDSSNGRVGGKGGPGGFGGGNGGDGPFIPPGSGSGPGGGKGGDLHNASLNLCGGAESYAGAGAYATPARAFYPPCACGYQSTNQGSAYGTALVFPLVGGSGGGGTIGSPGLGGGGGGGALLIASSNRIDIAATGTIRADGGEGDAYQANNVCGYALQHLNPGSGGAIRLIAPVVAGSGSLSAAGPTAGNPVGNDGFIRIDSIYRDDLNLNSYPFRTVGNFMVVLPTSRLDLVYVAGTSISEGSGPISIQLTNGSPQNQTVRVQARNFHTTNLLVNVVLTPQNGPAVTYRTNLDNLAVDPATVTVPVTIPVSTPVTVSAWTKVP